MTSSLSDLVILKKADIGISTSSSSVIKEVSDITVGDDVDELLAALREGRNLIFSCQRVIQFQIAIYFVGMCTSLFTSLFYRESPFALQ
jgi:magnesium-transporting ATPase (P-type)